MPINLTTPLLSADSIAGANTTVAAGGKAEKLHKAAHEFESLLVGEMLKSAREDGDDGWLGSGASTGSDSAMDMAESQLANALSSGKGLGLAGMIERTMQPRLPQNVADILPAAAVSGTKS